VIGLLFGLVIFTSFLRRQSWRVCRNLPRHSGCR